jgi:hypothetical protein
MKLHGFGVAGREHESGAGSMFGADRAEQVGLSAISAHWTERAD